MTPRGRIDKDYGRDMRRMFLWLLSVMALFSVAATIITNFGG